MPEPMHMDTTPKRAPLPRRASSCSSVAVSLAPVQPRGCPIAIAPPLGLTFSGSSPSFSMQYVACRQVQAFAAAMLGRRFDKLA